MFERFTERARKVVVHAQEEALRLKHDWIGTEHLLLGLLKEDEGIAARALNSRGVTLDEVREQTEAVLGYGEEDTGGQAPFTPRSKKVLEAALREALQLGHNYIGTEHLLLGLTDEPDGVAMRILVNLDAGPEVVRQEVLRMLNVDVESSPVRTSEPVMIPRTFYRSRYDRLIGGVCGGIAAYFGWDPRLVRVAMAGLIITTGGAGLAAYLLFWIFLPTEP